MKTLFVALLSFVVVTSLFAQVPQSITYQAIARDKQQKPLAGADLKIDIHILRNGNAVFEETQDVTTTATGLFVVNIGAGNPAAFQTIDWSAGTLLLKVDISGDMDIDVPATPFLTVPYAFLATDVVNKPQLSIDGQTLSISGGNSITLPAGNFTGGAGITIDGNMIINTGDTDPNDDLTSASQAKGDVTGPFSQLEIGPKAVGTAEINDQAVTGEKIAQMNATQGQVLRWNGSTWAPQTGAGDQWGTQTVVPGNALTGNGTNSSPLNLAQQGATTGQVLSWDGSKWAPANGGTAGNAGGDLSGPFSNLHILPNTITNVQIKDNSIGSFDLSDMGATQGQVMQWNGSQWIPVTITGSGSLSAGAGISIVGTTISNTGVLSTTKAAGDVSGTFSTLSVDKIKGRLVDSVTVPAMGQVLKWDGSKWKPQDDTGGTADNWGTQVAATDNATIAGNGTAIQPLRLNQQSATDGQVLKWNNATGTWKPANDLTGSTTVGVVTPGLSITGNATIGYTLANTGDTTDTDDLTKSSLAQGEVTGLFSSLKLVDGVVGTSKIAPKAVSGDKIAQMNATTNQVLKWNGTTWAPAADDAGTSQWVSDANGMYYPNPVNGTVRVNNSGGSKLVESGQANKTVPAQYASNYSPNAGSLVTYGANGQINVFLSHLIDQQPGSYYENNGAISVFGSDGYRPYPPVILYAGPDNSGSIYMTNANQDIMWQGGTFQNYGYLVLNNSNEQNIIYMGPRLAQGGGTTGSGGIEVLNGAGKSNVSLAHLDNFPNNGYASVRDVNGNNKAGIYVDANGNGRVFAENTSGTIGCEMGFNNGVGYIGINGTKSFFMTHPRDSTKEIWYACIEGPEAAAYERGTARLENGEAWVPFSEHFHEVINPATLTVTLTPLSADTDGLAVIEKTAEGIRVKELRGGKGNFGFDWEVKGVRKGYEDYQAVRPKQTTRRPVPAPAMPGQIHPVQPTVTPKN